MRGRVGAIYLPLITFSIGEGAVIPVLAVLTMELGGSLAVASIVAGGYVIGQLIGDLPSGYVVGRIGEKRAMMLASVVSMVAGAVCWFAESWQALAAGVVSLGIAATIFALARHAYMTVAIPIERRARALSLLGGSLRLGLFLGPWIAAVVVDRASTQAVFLVQLIACVVTLSMVFALPDPETEFGVVRPSCEVSRSFETSVRAHRHVLVRLGPGVALLAAMRASKTIIVPIWALHLGLSASETSLIVGVSAGAELLLFYTSGQIMDRYGRLSAAVPCLVGLVLGHLALLATSSFATLMTVAVLLGLVNGLGSGIQLTLGADIAPVEAPARVLGAWKVWSDTGSASSPLLLSGLIAIGSLALATSAMAVVGLLGVAILVRYVPRYAEPARGSEPEPSETMTAIREQAP